MKNLTLVMSLVICNMPLWAQEPMTENSPPPVPFASYGELRSPQILPQLVLEHRPPSIKDSSIPQDAKRVCIGRFNLGQFSSPSRRLELNLFDDAIYTAILTEIGVSHNADVHYYDVEGQPGGRLILVHRNGVIAGYAFIPGKGLYRITYSGQGFHSITEVDALKIDYCRAQPDPSASPAAMAGQTGLEIAISDLPLESASLLSNSVPNPIVDLLVVYTPAARLAADASGGHDAIEVEIILAVADVNDIFVRSLVNAHVRLVHMEEVSYVEHSLEIGVDAQRLAATADGYLDSVHPLRTAWGADLVSLIVRPANYTGAGLAWSGGFSAINRDVATSQHALAHELGHNFGCNHNRENASCTTNTCTGYNYGHHFYVSGDPNEYGTVMSYLGMSIPHFSNPNVSYLNVKTGVEETNSKPSYNAKQINVNVNSVNGVPGYRTSTFFGAGALENNDTRFRFQITGPNNAPPIPLASCIVEYSSDLIHWTQLGQSAYTLTSGSAQVIDDTIGSSGYRFYRGKPGTVYSINTIGFMKISVPSGYSMIANQLNNPVNNTVSTLIADVPDGSIIWKYNEALQTYYDANTFYAGFGWYPSPDMTLNPGEGVILENGTLAPVTLRFIGEVPQGYLTSTISTGFAIRSSFVPQAGPLNNPLGFPINSGQSLGKVYRMTGPNQTYTTYQYQNGAWLAPNGAATVSVGEAFWSEWNYPTSRLWSRNFSIWP